MLKIKYNQNGITMISLVTTVIVLIILTGIGISAVVGEGGLIKKSSEARGNTFNMVEDIQTGFNELYDERLTHRQ